MVQEGEDHHPRKEERRWYDCCYDCREVGHLVADCPNKKEKSSKDKNIKSKKDKEGKTMTLKGKKKGHALLCRVGINASSDSED